MDKHWATSDRHASRLIHVRIGRNYRDKFWFPLQCANAHKVQRQPTLSPRPGNTTCFSKHDGGAANWPSLNVNTVSASTPFPRNERGAETEPRPSPSSTIMPQPSTLVVPTAPSPPPPLYDTSISTHECETTTTTTSWHSSSHRSRDRDSSTGAARTPITTSPSTPHLQHRGWFPKSHPKSPRYDVRAFRRDEHHRPVLSEPILRESGDQQYSYRARLRKHHEGHHNVFPDPETNLPHLESSHHHDDDHDEEELRGSTRASGGGGRQLPVFTIDGIASEVALGARAPISPSSAWTRDLLSRLDTRRNNNSNSGSSNNNSNKNISERQQRTLRTSAAGPSSSARRDAPPPSSAEPSASRRADRERLSVVAAHRRHQREEELASQNERSGASSSRQTPPPQSHDDEDDDEELDKGTARSGNGGIDESWQGRAEIETPEPARVNELKQRLWDDRESLYDKSPVVRRRHVDLHYDRQSLNQRWKQWHGELHDDEGEAQDPSTPPRLSEKRAVTKNASNNRSRSLSPGTAASARSRTPPPPMLPLTPVSAYSTPKPQQQIFQSRFVQAAQRASPAAHRHGGDNNNIGATPTKPAPLKGTGSAAPRRVTSAFQVSSQRTSRAASEREAPAIVKNAVPDPTQQSRIVSRTLDPKATVVPAQAAVPPVTKSPLPPDATSVEELVARLQKVRRENPDQALAEIDAIIRQSHGSPAAAAVAAAANAPTIATDASSQPQEQHAVVAALSAPTKQRRPTERSGGRMEDNPGPAASAMNESNKAETPLNDRDKSYANRQDQIDEEAESSDDPDDEGSDDDETSVSSITNPTYGVVGSEYHHPRPTVLSTFKGAGQPRPSALSNYHGRSSLRTTELQQPAVHGRTRRHARHRSPPPSAIHVTREAGTKEPPASYQRLHNEGESELDVVLGTNHDATNAKALSNVPEETERNAPAQSSTHQPTQSAKEVEPRSATSKTEQLGSFPVSSDDPRANSGGKGSIHPSSTEPANRTLDPSNSAELAQKIKKWDEMSEPDFCPAAGCLNSRSSDHDLHRSPPVMMDSLVEMVCPRDDDSSAMKRRHHPWDSSIPVCMGQVSVHETSMDHAAGVETEYSMKYQDARSEMSVSVEASSGGGMRKDPRAGKTSQDIEPKGRSDSKAPTDGQGRECSTFSGDAFEVNPRLVVSPDSVGDNGSGFSSEHQAYARNLADDFDSAWVSLPSSSFFRGSEQNGFHTDTNLRDGAVSQARVLSVSKQGDSSTTRRSHHDQYQTFRAREGVRRTEQSAKDTSGKVGITKTFEAAGTRNGEKGGVEVAILNDVQQKPAVAVPTSASEYSSSRRGLRKFLKLRQAGRTAASMSQSSVSTSSRSQLPSVSVDLQSASLDLEAAEAPPPTLRGRSQRSPDRLRSRSLDERRIRNPHIAKKFSRLLRVYEENPSKQFGVI